MSNDNTSQRILTAAAGNVWSRVYLGVTLALLIGVWVNSHLVTHADASFAGIFPILFTAPTSLLLLAIPGVEGLGAFLLIVLAAVINATLIGLVVSRLRAPAPN
jgi:hypothetical protein